MSARDDILDRRIKRIVSGEPYSPGDLPACPDESQIVLYRENGLGDAECAALESHFAECPRCLDTLVAYTPLAADRVPGKKEVPSALLSEAKSFVRPSSSGLSSRLRYLLGPLWNRWTPVWATPLLLILLIPVFWMAAKPAIEQVVVKRAQSVLGVRGVTIQGLDIGWRSVLIKGLTLAENDQKVVSVGNVTFEFDLDNLLDGEVVISRLTMDSPQFSLAGDKSGEGFTFRGLEKLDFSALGGAPVRFESSTIIMTNGSLTFSDNSMGPEPVIIELSGVDLTASNFNYPAAGTPTFQMQGKVTQPYEPGSFRITGSTDTGSGNVTLDARFDNIDLTLAAPYLKDRITVGLKGGQFDAELKVSKQNNGVETSGAFWLKDLVTTDTAGEFLGAPIPRLMDLMAVNAGGVKIPFEIDIKSGQNRGLLLEDILDALEIGLRQAVKS